jgi:hypothetical protein
MSTVFTKTVLECLQNKTQCWNTYGTYQKHSVGMSTVLTKTVLECLQNLLKHSVGMSTVLPLFSFLWPYMLSQVKVI